MKITFKHIRQLECIARHRNFLRAAEELHISQPALSRSVASLEEQLGVLLLDRTGRTVRLTRYGEYILGRGRTVLQAMRQMHRDLYLLQGGMRGDLSIGCGPVPAHGLLGKVLGSFCRDHPAIRVQVTIDRVPRLVEMLLARKLDLFIGDVRLVQESSRFQVQALPQQQGYFCCRPGHPLTKLPNPTLRDIGAYPLAVMWLPDAMKTRFLKILRPENNDPDGELGMVECDSMRVLHDIVGNSDMVGWSTAALLGDPPSHGIRLLPPALPELATHYAIVSLQEESPSPLLPSITQYFLDAGALAG